MKYITTKLIPTHTRCVRRN